MNTPNQNIIHEASSLLLSAAQAGIDGDATEVSRLLHQLETEVETPASTVGAFYLTVIAIEQICRLTGVSPQMVIEKLGHDLDFHEITRLLK